MNADYSPGSDELIYRIDAQDRIISVNEQWEQFALQNSPRDRQDFLAAGQIYGRSLWDFIQDRTTREIYRSLIQRVRRHTGIRFTFRCDSPECKRLLQMNIEAEPNGSVAFHTFTLEIEVRAPQLMLDANLTRNADKHIIMCGWCNRMNTPRGWLDVEDAVTILRLFNDTPLPALSHGVCDDCYKNLRAVLENPDDSPPASVSILSPNR